jgi:hypothetical protein
LHLIPNKVTIYFNVVGIRSWKTGFDVMCRAA